MAPKLKISRLVDGPPEIVREMRESQGGQMSKKISGEGAKGSGSAIVNKVAQIVESPQDLVIVGGTAMAGGVSGGTAGAGVGAAIGSLLGPPGAAVGFLIGLVVGTTGGTLAGGCAGDYVNRKVGG